MNDVDLTPRDPSAFRDGWMFVREAARDLRTTGAIAPSGKALSWALTQPVRAQASRPLSVLEVGAGTGSVTRVLIDVLSAGSRLDVVESNRRFAARLRRLVDAHPRLAALPHQVQIHQDSIEQFAPADRYDVIISGLPMKNFSPHQVERIMDKYQQLLHPGGVLTYFAYRGARHARVLLGSRRESRRHDAVDRLMNDYQQRLAITTRTVWANLPPAAVWQLQTADAPAPSPESR
ncbi:hypothetical protein Athai_61030 [Actinocatenispora thailandica]|uniref:Methyltransferase domain-containing protein n=1 Tax=Actinocatenispora thailandica TaxID=227318 RepID=A0A7R7DVW9_9ACTN|nr:methyltransferase domain-containing protein [Actinocatenispora thailandica]BCJ38600.1 hypothetical protein Athai_61030 [Actinocatenispora thailandica]